VRRCFVSLLTCWVVVIPLFAQGVSPVSPTNTPAQQTANSSSLSVPLQGQTSIVFESFDRVFVKNYERVAVQEVIFTGNVQIVFEGKRLSAQRVYVTIQSNTNILEIAAFDNVEFHDKNALYLADSFFYQPEKKTGRMMGVRSYLKDTTGTTTSPGLFYKANEVEILSEKRAVFKKAYLTFTPAEKPHYTLYAEKVWYFRDDAIFSLHNVYRVGQTRFFYFPVFLRLEKVTGIRTSAGIEKRIGWYVMNTMDWSPSFGTMQLGLDFYERMGEYGFVRYVNKQPIGPFQQVRFFGETADDIRLFYDAQQDRYSQLVLVNNEWTTIRQWAWHYALEGTVQKENFALSFYTEDLNDPFFSKKYSSRRENFNIQHILQPNENAFFSQSDNAPGYPSISRRFSITSPQVSLNGQWTYQRTRNEQVSNIYRNDAYRYYLYQVSFPNITYTLPTIPLLERVSFTTTSYRTNRLEQGGVSFFAVTTNATEKALNTNRVGLTNEQGLVTNLSLGEEKALLVKEEVLSNTFEWASLSSYFSGNLGYNSSETLDTNGMPISDQYTHQENGSLSLQVVLLNRLITWDHSLNILNRKKWSSFELNYSNNLLYSGAQVDYTMRTSSSVRPRLGMDPLWSVEFPSSISHVFQYQLYRSIDQGKPREYSHRVDASTGISWLSNIVVYKLSSSYQTTYRITNGVEDDYINNQIRETIGGNTSLAVWWFSFSTGVTLDILSRRSASMVWRYPDITNRIQGSVILASAFTPVSPWTYIPQVRYRYDLIKKTNVSLSFSSYATVGTWYPTGIYKMESFAYQANLTLDYLSPRSSIFSFTVGTSIWLQKYWKLDFSTQVVNRKLYRYNYTYAGIFNEPYVNFWQNLWDGINIFNYDGLRRSFFKVQTLNFGLTHYLNEWEMRVGFSIQRQVDQIRRLAYWEPQLKVEFMLSGTRDQFPPYTKRFVPEELQ